MQMSILKRIFSVLQQFSWSVCVWIVGRGTRSFTAMNKILSLPLSSLQYKGDQSGLKEFKGVKRNIEGWDWTKVSRGKLEIGVRVGEKLLFFSQLFLLVEG